MTFVEKDDGGGSARAGIKPTAHAFLAALPVGFVLVFGALLAGHLAVGESNPARSWQLLVSAMVLAATGFVATRALIAAGLRSPRPGALAWACAAGLVAAAGFSAALMVVAYGPASLSPGDMLNVLAGRARDGRGPYFGSEFWVTQGASLAWQ